MIDKCSCDESNELRRMLECARQENAYLTEVDKEGRRQKERAEQAEQRAASYRAAMDAFPMKIEGKNAYWWKTQYGAALSRAEAAEREAARLHDLAKRWRLYPSASGVMVCRECYCDSKYCACPDP